MLFRSAIDRVVLMYEDVALCGQRLNVMYDSGHSISVINKNTAKRCGLSGPREKVSWVGPGGGVLVDQESESILLPVPENKEGGRGYIHVSSAQITRQPLEAIPVEISSGLFPHVPVRRFCQTGGEIDLIIGADTLRLWPT